MIEGSGLLQNKKMRKNITVDVRSLRSTKRRLGKYLNMDKVRYFSNQEVEFSQSLFESINNRRFGIGVYGDKMNEPHLVLLNNDDEYLSIIDKFGLDKRMNPKTILKNLRYLASVFGNYFTFNKRLFPHGINFNIVLLKQDSFYIATHRNNIVTNKRACKYQQIEKGYCACVASEYKIDRKLLRLFGNLKGGEVSG